MNVPNGEGLQSTPHSSEQVWLDAAPLLQHTCTALAYGQLLHDDSFSLFDSMSAIEIGDPRMDAGADTGARDLQQLLEAGAAPMGLSALATLAVLDRALAEEASWHGGHFLHQTVFTCLYMLAPERAAGNVILSAFCGALRATVDAVRTLSITGHVCEDEDLLPHAFGLSLDDTSGGRPRTGSQASELTAERMASLSLVEERLIANGVRGLGFGTAAAGPMPEAAGLESSNSTAGTEHATTASSASEGAVVVTGGGSVAGIADPVGKVGSDVVTPAVREERGQGQEEVLSKELLDAFLARLRFRRHLHQALTRFEGRTVKDVDAMRQHVIAAIAELEGVRKSASLAEGQDVSAAFNATVNRSLMAPTPPRTVPALSQDQLWKHYTEMLGNLLVVCDITAVSSWEELQAFLAAFSAVQPGPVERSVLHMLLCSQDGRGNPTAKWAPRAAMLSASLGMPSDSSQWGAEGTLFVEQAVLAARGWCQAMCLNRGRLRRRLRKTLRDDWCHMYQHALNADASPELQHSLAAAGWTWTSVLPDGSPDTQGPMSTWVERGAAAVQLQDMLLGFRLKLHAPHELCMTYWYADYLLGILVQNTMQLIEGRPRGQASAMIAGKGQAAKKAAKAAKAAAHRAAEKGVGDLAHLALEVQGMEAARSMCQALFRQAVGLQLAHKISTPDFPYNQEEQRFDQRFAAYFSLTKPAPLDYQQYRNAMNVTDCTASRLYALAAASYLKAHQEALAFLKQAEGLGLNDDKVQEMKMLDRVAIQNSIALKILDKANKDGSDDRLKVTLEFPRHPWLAVLVLKG